MKDFFAHLHANSFEGYIDDPANLPKTLDEANIASVAAGFEKMLTKLK